MASSYLIHYNHNHDKLGRFARSTGSAASTVGGKVTGKKKQKVKAADIKKGKAANTKLSRSERERIVNSGSAKEVSKYQSRLSNRELETAVKRLQQEKINRIDLERQLSSLSSPKSQKKINSAISWMDKHQSDITTVVNFSTEAIKLYNNVAAVNNAFSSEKLPTIGNSDKKLKPKKPNK